MQAIAAINAKPESGSAGVVQNGAKKSKTSSFASLLDSLKTASREDKPSKTAATLLNENPGTARGIETRNQSPLAMARAATADKPVGQKKNDGTAAAEVSTALQGAKPAGVSALGVQTGAQNKAAPLPEQTPKNADVRETESSKSLEKNIKKKQPSSPSDTESAGANLAAVLSATGDKSRAPAKGADFKDPADGMKLSTERNPSGAKISVVDMRLKASKEGGKAPSEEKDSSGRQNPDSGMQSAAPDSRDTRAEFGRSPETAAGKQSVSDSKPVSFADQLASRIRESAGSDIVKAAHIVLRDGDAGMIRLRLDPESLGGVKIELKIADKKLSGVIVVESDIAGQAFKDSLESLRDAFNASGFETQSLEVEVRNGNSGGQESSQNGNEGTSPYFSQRLKELDDAVPQVRASASRDGLINVVI